MQRKFITKEAAVGDRKQLDMAFFSATREDLRKQMDVADYSSLPDGYIAGWASTPDLDLYRHVVMPGAFDKSIREKGLNGPKGIKLLIQHDRSKVAGKIVKLEMRGDSLWIEAQLNLKISYVRDMYEAAKDVGGLSFSVGFYLEEYEFKADANKDEYLQINQGELEEVSLVVFPGNPEAVNTFLKDDAGAALEVDLEDIPSFEKALVASGLAKSRNDAQRITQVVKRNVALFRQGAAEAPQPAPVAKEKLDKVSDAIAKLKNLFD